MRPRSAEPLYSNLVPGDAQVLCRNIFDQVWNREDHAYLLKAVPSDFRIEDPGIEARHRGPLLLIDLINCYKSAVPDLMFLVEKHVPQNNAVTLRWSATGHHCGFAFAKMPTGAPIKLRGVLFAKLSNSRQIRALHGLWDVTSYVSQLGVTIPAFNRSLCLRDDEVRLRGVMQRQGPPLLLFPAMSLPGWMTWRRLIHSLQEQRPVLTFQLLANRMALEGRHIPAGYSVRAETRAIEGALEHEGMSGPFDVVGHSAGGVLALDFALENQRKIRSLTLIEPPAAWVLEEAGCLDNELRAFLQDRVAAYSGDVTEERYAAFLRETMGDPYYDPAKASHWSLLSAYRGNMLFRPALYRYRDRIRRLRAVEFPVLLVRGSRCTRFHREVIRLLEEQFRNVQSVELPGGHAPHHGSGMWRFLRVLSKFHAECD